MMGKKSKKSMYRLPAFCLAVILLFTSIPSGSVVSAAGLQEKEAVVTTGEETVSQNEAQEKKEETTEEETTEEETAKEGTKDAENGDSEENREENQEETQETSLDMTAVKEATEQIERAAEEDGCSLTVQNGLATYFDRDPLSVSENEVGGVYTYAKGTNIQVSTHREGLFEGWYNEKGECLSKETFYDFSITEDMELTAKWNTSLVEKNVETVFYQFYNYTGDPWTPDGNVLKSGVTYTNGESSLGMSLFIPEEGAIVQFDYATSSEEGFDRFMFGLGDVYYCPLTESGKKDYQTYAVRLEEGSYSLYFTYQKDWQGTGYDDCAYVKNISIEPMTDEEVTIKTLSNDENGGTVLGGGSYPYGSEVTLKATPAQGYLFMGWKNAEGDIIDYAPEKGIAALTDETYTAQFLSEAAFKDACEGIIDGNDRGENRLITVSKMEGAQLALENGALKRKNGMEGESLLEFQVTGELEGRKYFHFDFYDPRGGLLVKVGVPENGEVRNYTSYYSDATNKSCSFEICEGSVIQITNNSYYEYISPMAYIRNLEIIDEQEEVKITPVTEDKSLGSVAGGGTVAYGEKVRVKAIPKEGCEFCYWKDEQGNVVSYDTVFYPQTVKDAVYIAVFRKIEVEKESLATILKDDSQIVKKVLMRGGKWTPGNRGEFLSPALRGRSAVIEMIVEIPEGKCYELSTKGCYDGTCPVSFYCSADGEDKDDGYFFPSDWRDDTVISSIYLTPGIHTIYFVYGDLEYAFGEVDKGTAQLKEIRFEEITGTAKIEGKCTGDVGYEYITLPNTIKGLGNYEIGETITLEAPSIDGYFFCGWQQAGEGYYDYVSTKRSMTLCVTQDAEWEAVYRKMPEGFVDSTFTLLPEGDWYFDMQEGCSYQEGELSVSFSVSEKDTKVLCYETRNGDSNRILVYVDGELYGEHTASSEYYEKGFIPFESGVHTVKWVIDIIGSGSYPCPYVQNISLVSQEELKEQTVNLQVSCQSNNGFGIITGEGDYKYGETATLKAEADASSQFLGWIAPDGTLCEEPEIQVLMDKNKVYKAYFVRKNYKEDYLDAVVEDSRDSIRFENSMWSRWFMNETGYIYMDRTYYMPHGPLRAVVTVPQDEEQMLTFHYAADWSGYYPNSKAEGSLHVSVNGKEALCIPYDPKDGDTSYHLPLSAGENIVEWNFVLEDGLEKESWEVDIFQIGIKTAKYYTVEAKANDTSFGSVTGSGKYVYNQAVTLKAVPGKGYIFKEWQMNGETVSTEPEYAVWVTEDTAYTAIFEKDGTSGGEEEGDNKDTDKEDDNKENTDTDKTEGGNGQEDHKDNTKDETIGTGKEDGNKETHSHTAGEWVVVKDATGKETGLKVKKCTLCGMEMEEEVIPKYEVRFNVKGTVPLEVKKSTTAIKVVLMDGDKVKDYQSSNKKIASVNKKGKITAKKTGKAKITVTTIKGATATITIKVQKNPVKTKKIAVDKTKLSLKKGQSYPLVVTKTPVTSLEKITFATSDKKVATVSKKGKITAKKKGKATITIRCGKKKKTVKVTVN